MPIAVKRAYEPASRSDGLRILVDRMWPRGIKKNALEHDAWMKELAPSHELRKWFGHDPKRWAEFKTRYFDELRGKPELWKPLLAQSRKRRLTLVYSARDEAHNQAVALAEFLRRRKTG